MDTESEMRRIAVSALANWRIEDAQMDLIEHRENAVYKVTMSDGSKRALRIHRRDYHTDDELRSELKWLQALNDYGVPAPEVIPAIDGSLFAYVEGARGTASRQCDLLAWVDGAPLGGSDGAADPDPMILAKRYYAIGKLMARLHNHACEWLLPDGFARHAWDADGIAGPNPLWGRFWELEELKAAQTDLLQAAAEIIRHRLDQFGQGIDRYGLIHADFSPENLLVADGEIKLIDFDNAGFGWYLFDIATSLFLFLGKDNFDIALNSLVDGYRTVRELPGEHLEMLPTFLTARGLTYVGWLHTRRETKTAMQLTADVVASVCTLAEDYCS